MCFARLVFKLVVYLFSRVRLKCFLREKKTNCVSFVFRPDTHCMFAPSLRYINLGWSWRRLYGATSTQSMVGNSINASRFTGTGVRERGGAVRSSVTGVGQERKLEPQVCTGGQRIYVTGVSGLGELRQQERRGSDQAVLVALMGWRRSQEEGLECSRIHEQSSNRLKLFAHEAGH